jgi:hypothetical protein
MTDAERRVVWCVVFVGMFILLIVLRAIYDAFREP